MGLNNKKILITGGAGFVGHHLVEGLLKDTDWEIVILDRLDVSGNLERLRDIECWNERRVKFIWWDLKAPLNEFVKRDIGEVDYIWHLAASSHVDRSIEDPLSFVMDNVVGTCNLLNFAREINPKLVIVFGTDEEFGPAPQGVNYKEDDRFKPGNPYAASKVGATALGDAFYNTYKLPVINTFSMNVFGERQHPEKFIPLVIKKVLAGDKVLIHSDKTKTKSGSRFWIHARNVFRALMFLTEKGKTGEKYNIVGEKEVSNLELAQFIAKVIGKPLNYEMIDFHSSRPGHDLRYSLDGTKMAEMGWRLPKTFEESLEKTIKWMIRKENRKWLNL